MNLARLNIISNAPILAAPASTEDPRILNRARRTRRMSDLPSEQVDAILASEDRFYAPVEVAHILNLQQATVQELCRNGAIRAQKIGTQWRITGVEIRRYISEGPIKESQ